MQCEQEPNSTWLERMLVENSESFSQVWLELAKSHLFECMLPTVWWFWGILWGSREYFSQQTPKEATTGGLLALRDASLVAKIKKVSSNGWNRSEPLLLYYRQKSLNNKSMMCPRNVVSLSSSLARLQFCPVDPFHAKTHSFGSCLWQGLRRSTGLW